MVKEKAHEISSALKQLAHELGRVPTRDEFCAHTRFNKHVLKDIFGSYTQLLQANGFEPNKSDSKHNYQDINKALDDYAKPVANCEYELEHPRILVLGDTHFPFIHKPSLERALELVKELEANVVVQVGDLYDCFAQGRFPRSLNTYNPKQEIDLAFSQASEMWASIKRINSGIHCFQLHGNHTVRPIKQLIDKAPELEPFMEFKRFLSFDGVHTIHDIRQELIINRTAFIHGFRSRLGDHMEYNGLSTVCGHSHLGGVVYKRKGNQTLFELNAGYLADPLSKALGYTPQKITKWTHGVGFINELGPMFIPF